MISVTSLNSFYRSGHGTAYVVQTDQDPEALIGRHVLLDGHEVTIAGTERHGTRIVLLVTATR